MKEKLVFCYWDDVWDIPIHSQDKEDLVNIVKEEDYEDSDSINNNIN